MVFEIGVKMIYKMTFKLAAKLEKKGNITFLDVC